VQAIVLWLWPIVVLGTVAAVGLIVVERDRRRRHHPKPGE
jgi:cytochrome c-type biogenesis protein CcmH/NrfF